MNYSCMVTPQPKQDFARLSAQFAARGFDLEAKQHQCMTKEEAGNKTCETHAFLDQ